MTLARSSGCSCPCRPYPNRPSVGRPATAACALAVPLALALAIGGCDRAGDEAAEDGAVQQFIAEEPLPDDADDERPWDDPAIPDERFEESDPDAAAALERKAFEAYLGTMQDRLDLAQQDIERLDARTDLLPEGDVGDQLDAMVSNLRERRRTAAAALELVEQSGVGEWGVRKPRLDEQFEELEAAIGRTRDAFGGR